MTSRIGVLGPVRIAGRDVGGTPMRALLAALALAGAGSTRSVSALAEDVWGDEPPQNPKAALQTLVSRTRALAGADAILSTPGGYALGTDDIDLTRARVLLGEAEGRAETDPRRCALLREARELWRGEPGADLGAAPVAEELSAVAETLHRTIELRLASALVAGGQRGEGIPVLERIAAASPHDEAVHLALMTALAADGRTSDALSVFARVRSALREALGSSPGPALTELNARLLRVQDGPARVRIGVQAAPNELIGRDEDLARLGEMLTRSRAVTILGAGGLGKTRLAQAVAAGSVAPAVAVVPLAGVRADADVPLAIAASLGISEAGPGGRLSDPRARLDLRARVVALLSERTTLLVLDNCEQVIDAVAAWAADMLDAVPGLRILTTSRTPLAIAAEAVYPLAALTTDTADDEGLGSAVRLFVERARAARPGATLPLDVVRRLCTHLDGLPLAIELAAARVRTMTPDQIEARLQDRFALLTSGDRAAPERHRTLEAVIEWSWDLLDADAQRALARLSVLPAGFSAATAAAVLGEAAVDDVLDRLVSQSLLIVADEPGGADVRFRMLETVREFGLTRLALPGFEGEDAAWAAVFGWARTFAAQSGSALLDNEAYRRIRGEHDNLIAVLRRAVDTGDDEQTVLAFSLLCQSWLVRGSFTELTAFSAATFQAAARVSHEKVDPDALAVVLVMGSFIGVFGEEPWGIRLLAHLRVFRRRHPDLGPVQGAIADLLCAVPDRVRMMAVMDRFAVSDDSAVAVIGASMRAQIAENDGDVELAMRAARHAWSLAQRANAGWIGAMSASTIAQLASQSARPTEAVAWLERAREQFLAFGADEQVRQQQWILGGNLVSLGRYDEAGALFQELCASRELTDDGLELASIGWLGLAELEHAQGRAAHAAELYDHAMASFVGGEQRASPWYLMAIAAVVSATATDGSTPRARVAQWARRLRTRWLATQRIRPDYVDRPVLGTVLAGWSAWALREDGLQGIAVRALALGETLSARQDLPSLHLAPHFADAEALAGAEVVAVARAEAAALTPDERVALAAELLTRSR